MNAIKRKGFVPTQSSKICSEHFRESDFLNQPGFKYKRLKDDAVPSVFTEFPEHLQKKPCYSRGTKASRKAVSTFTYYTTWKIWIEGGIYNVFHCEEGSCEMILNVQPRSWHSYSSSYRENMFFTSTIFIQSYSYHALKFHIVPGNRMAPHMSIVGATIV